MNAIQAALQCNWLMEPCQVENLLRVAERRGELRDFMVDGKLDRDLIAAVTGKPLKGTERATYRTSPDGKKVAVLDVIGPLFKRANLMTEMSGATSYELLATDFTAALSDESVKGIVLNIDSPGGEANGCHEMARLIYAARGIKPLASYVGGMGDSGGYFIAAAAPVIVMDAMAEVGSIGVVTSARKNADSGLITFTSTNAPFKRIDPESKTGSDIIRAELDATEAVFIESVAQFRSVSAETVRRDFGRGGIKIGREAVAAGMADSLGSLEGVIAALMNDSLDEFSTSRGKASQTPTPKPPEKTSKMNWKALFGGMTDEEKAEAQAHLEGQETVPAQLTAPVDMTAHLKEIEALRQKVADLESDKNKSAEADREAAKLALDTDADAFTLELTKGGKILPAQAGIVKSQYLAAHGTSPEALEGFKSLMGQVASLPADLTKEEGVDAVAGKEEIPGFVLPSMEIAASDGDVDVDAQIALFNAQRGHKAK